MKILSVVGARPQFIKAISVSTALRATFTEVVVHTGQHYDDEMSAVFFRELGIPAPDYNLNIGSGSHGKQTGAMLAALENVIVDETPDCVLTYGDTNSTLAGTLAAAKLNIPIAHVEAGLRSFNRTMPEEVNRVLTDHTSSFLFCPTQKAVDNLTCEGIRAGVHLVGDVMMDTLSIFLPRIDQQNILVELGVEPKVYILATVHRASNTESPEKLKAVFACFAACQLPIIFPVHPRTHSVIEKFDMVLPANVKAIPPVGYLQMLALEKSARFILTDSGGIQKEAYILAVPCITLREETEWNETLIDGWNILVGLNSDRVRQALNQPQKHQAPPPVFGDGRAAQHITRILGEELK